MIREFIVSDSIVANLHIKAPAPQPPPETGPRPEPWFRRISQLLGAVRGPRRATEADLVRLFCRGLISPDCVFVLK